MEAELPFKPPKRVTALFDWIPEKRESNKPKLPLKKGQKVLVIRAKKEKGWWLGEDLESKQQGFFPSNYTDAAERMERKREKERKMLNFQSLNLKPNKFNRGTIIDDLPNSSRTSKQTSDELAYRRLSKQKGETELYFQKTQKLNFFFDINFFFWKRILQGRFHL